MNKRPEISCQDLAPHLESIHRGDASADLAALADAHLAHCPACRRQLAQIKRLSRMFQAWRPRRVSNMAKIEAAAMVSQEVGELAAQLLPQEKADTLHRRRLRRLPPLRSWQSAINWLAVAALLFAAAAIVYQVVRSRHLSGLSTDDASTPVENETPRGETSGSAGRAGDDAQNTLAEQYEVVLLHPGTDENAIFAALREATGLAPSSVREMIRRTPVVISRQPDETAAQEVAARLSRAGARAEIRPARQ